MQAIYRLKKNASYDYVYKNGKSFACAEYVLICLKVNAKSLKAGFPVSKKLGKAVVRNKLRRRMKEHFRSMIPNLKTGYNMVFVAREAAGTASFLQLGKSMEYLLKKADVFMPKL